VADGDPAPSDSEVVSTYWTQHRLSSSETSADRLQADGHFWAWMHVDRLVTEDPDAALQLTLLLADAAPDDAALAYLGAGPIEDLLVHHATPTMVDRICGWAGRNERFCVAVRSAWLTRVDEGTAERISKLGRRR